MPGFEVPESSPARLPASARVWDPAWTFPSVSVSEAINAGENGCNVSHHMGAPRWILDASAAPLYTARLAEPPKELPDIEALLAELKAMLAKKERLVLVYDATYARPDAARRRRMADWMEENVEDVRRYMVACAVVAPNAVQRGVIVALRWLHAPVIPFESFGDVPSARAWTMGIGIKAGLRFPQVGG